MIRKISIRGEVFPFDDERHSLAEAIALEEGLGMNYVQWFEGLGKGSAKALAGQVWLILHRAGKDVTLADILSGAYEVDLEDITAEPDPTEPEPLPSSDTSDGSTSGSSPTSSDTRPGSSTSSPSASSTP